MESLMSFSELSIALGGRLFAGEGKQETGAEGFSSVCIDSRAACEGALFVALRGSALDGHRFVEAAFKAGAAGALVAFSALGELAGLERKWNRVLVAVEDTLKGLQNAAAAYLRRFSKLVKIGITGSAGKTTTKEIAAAMISREKSVVMNRGNLNSETGLPLSVFEVRLNHEIGIFEAGTSRPGEMEDLAKVLNPDLALITNIGSAHIGFFGSREAIAEEKKKIFSQFTGNNTALIPDDDDFRDLLARGLRGKAVFYKGLSSLGEVKGLGLEGTEFLWEGERVSFGLPGKFNLQNALAAVALARELGISAASIRSALAAVKPLFGRGEILKGRTTLIRDCYNSNPESSCRAIDFCDDLEWPGRKVYVMGSMLELGAASDEAHAELGKRLACSKAGLVFLFGEEMRVAARALEGAPFFHTCDKYELSRQLDLSLKSGDLVLLKASRGCELEVLTGVFLGEENVS